MAAANSDYYTEVGSPGSATTLAAPGHSISGTSFTVVSTSNWPTGTGVIFAVDTFTTQVVNGVSTAVRTAGTYTEWEGTVTNSTTISNATLRYGTDQNYPAGSTTRVYIPVSSSRENRLVQGLQAAGLNQDATMTPVVKTSINDTNGNEVIKTPATGSAVNEITVTNAATGTAPSISATGGDSTIHLNLRGKGLAKTVTIGAGATTIYPYDFVASGCVWTADAAGSTRVASMTAGVVVINGNPVTVAAVTSRTFTPSKDVYVDVLDNGDGTGLLVYTDGTTNAASGALAANSVRLAIVVVGASSIAAAASINQGQEDRVLPIASSIAYAVTDSLGNLICPRDPNRKLLGYARISGAFTTTTVSSIVDVTGLQTTCVVPTGRKIRVRFTPTLSTTGTSATLMTGAVRESTTVIAMDTTHEPTSQYNSKVIAEQILTPSAGTHTYKASVDKNSAGTLTVNAGTGSAATYMALELFVELM